MALIAAAGMSLLAACSADTSPRANKSERTSTSLAAGREADSMAPRRMAPLGGGSAQPGDRQAAQGPSDLTQPGALSTHTAVAVVEDTRLLPVQTQITGPWMGPVQDIEEMVPEHEGVRPKLRAGPPNALVPGGLLAEPRTIPGMLFPGIGQTPWTPPDCTLAVGPSHIVSTVNMALAFHTKTGTLQFSSNLDNTGNPGFFESVGAGGFTFDPKCFYDHYAGRFVVIAPEVYGSTEAWICIAVSDDSDPNGVWYKYRTNAVVTVGSNTYWWDYPGFGYDDKAYYMTGNLFGLNNGGWGGVGFRVFNKTPLLSGQPVTYTDLRDAGAGSVQVAQHFGAPQAPFFVSTASSTALRVHAIRNPTTSPTLVSTTVTVPSFSGPGSAPANGGNSVSLIDDRIFNAHWRDGALYATHGISSGGKNVARWYHMNTNNWPTSGNVTLVQSGNVNPGGSINTFFPAIYSNSANSVGMVVGASSSTTRISVNTTGRAATDAPGTMGALTQAFISPVDGGGRWGDYYGIALDPSDSNTFWIIGEYAGSSGWGTWISSFQINATSDPVATDDTFGNVFSNYPATIDVLANDFSPVGQALTISTFQGTSVHGGVITRSVGTGPGGRDQLIYAAPSSYSGPDSFTYTIADTQNRTDSATVFVTSQGATVLRDPENPSYDTPGIAVDYYALASSYTSMPPFASLTPYQNDVVTQINYASSNFGFATSGRFDNVGAVYSGFVTVSTADLYTFYTSSDDGSKLYIGNTLVVSNDGIHSSMVEASGVIGLKPGTHAIRVEFYTNTGPQGLIVSASSSSMTKAPIDASMWSHGTCAADFDGSGFLDFDDYNAFVVQFELGDASADFDGSGFVDFDDFIAYVVAFEAGC